MEILKDLYENFTDLIVNQKFQIIELNITGKINGFVELKNDDLKIQLFREYDKLFCRIGSVHDDLFFDLQVIRNIINQKDMGFMNSALIKTFLEQNLGYFYEVFSEDRHRETSSKLKAVKETNEYQVVKL